MSLLYTLFIYALDAIFHLASWFNPKAALLVSGRKGVFQRLQDRFDASRPLVWVHCASLGEFEQGRPVIEALRQQMPHVRILLTFYSPSGYEVRKNYDLADHVDYLPSDTPAHASRFMQVIKPTVAIFVKYEFWSHYYRAIRRAGVPLLNISTIVRPGQIYFQWYGAYFRRTLQCVTHYFVQNTESQDLLQGIGIREVTVAGDTRFDRVHAITEQGEDIPQVSAFKDGKTAWVIGSAWLDDLEVLAPFINENQGNLKFIIAPHEIDEATIGRMEQLLQVRSVRFSRATENAKEFDCLIIDNIGMLSRLYRYGEYAWVGGAYGKGLHNILEAACYGLPVFFGNRNYKKYQEANDLILRGGAFDIADYADLRSRYEGMDQHPDTYALASAVTREYVQANLGATRKIMDYCQTLLKP